MIKNNLLFFIFLCLINLILFSCTEHQPVPKPPTYLNINFPEHTYSFVRGDCPYEFKLATLFNYRTIDQANKNYCIQEIDLGLLNGTLLLYPQKIHFLKL